MKRMLTLEELLAECRRFLSEQKFPHGVAFDIPGSKNVAMLQVTKGYQEGKLTLTVNVYREGSRYLHTHYYDHRTEEDMRKYLAGDEDAERIIASIRELSASVDDREGEFPSDY